MADDYEVGHPDEKPVFHDSGQGVEPVLGGVGVVDSGGKTSVDDVIAVVSDIRDVRCEQAQGRGEAPLFEAPRDEGLGPRNDLDRQRGLGAESIN